MVDQFTRMKALDAEEAALDMLITKQRDEVAFFRKDLVEEEQLADFLAKVLHVPNSDNLITSAEEIVGLDEEGLKLALQELLDYMKKRRRLHEERNKLEGGPGQSLPQ
jgi:hypothetical protein